MLRTACRLALAGSVGVWAGAAQAQPANQRIEISGTPLPNDDARDAPAARRVVSRDEIRRHGDTSLTEVLRRVPGIAVSSDGVRAVEIRLRGLGGGRVQILLNGEPLPQGFQLDSISPQQVERIEISSASTADVASQAIAGTIDIVLTRAARAQPPELKLAAAERDGLASAYADFSLAGRSDSQRWALSAALREQRERWPAHLSQTAFDPFGRVTQQRRADREARGTERGGSLAPQWSWQDGERQRVGVELQLRHTAFDDRTHDERLALAGPAPAYAADDLALALRTTFARARLNWRRTLDNGIGVELRAGGDGLRRRSQAEFSGFDATGTAVLSEQVASRTDERTPVLAGKLRWPYSEAHALAFGFDADRNERRESRSQRQTSPTGRPTVDLDEAFESLVERGALYLQDEWFPSDAVSVYAGARWTTLRTLTSGTGLAETGGRFEAFSPVLQALWKPGGAESGNGSSSGPQLRLALSRSWRPPRTRDLVPRRYVALDNTPTTPDLQGNPALRPELAWGLDLAAEHWLARDGGMVSLSAGARRISDTIVERLARDATGAWVQSKVNDGHATTWSLEFESRLRGSTFEGRLALARYGSKVDGLPGPDNRLDSQVPWSGSVGAEWRPAGGVTLGVEHTVQGGVRAQVSATQHTRSEPRRVLDLFGTWRPSRDWQWRLALTNLLARDRTTFDEAADAAGRFTQTTREPTARGIRLGADIRF